MSEAVHHVPSAFPKPCHAPKSQRNPFAGRCHLPAGHNGEHQWDREPSSSPRDVHATIDDERR